MSHQEVFKKLNNQKNNPETSETLLDYLENVFYRISEVHFSKFFEIREELPSCASQKPRAVYTSLCSWSLIDRYSLEEIQLFVKEDKILEIAAGLGLWSYLLQKKGVNIHPTSLFDGYHLVSGVNSKNEVWLPVEELSAMDAIHKYRDVNVLFICWGSKDYSEEINCFQGNKIIVIGQLKGCQTYYFDRRLRYRKKFSLVKIIHNPNWKTITDNIFCYEKIGGPSNDIQQIDDEYDVLQSVMFENLEKKVNPRN